MQVEINSLLIEIVNIVSSCTIFIVLIPIIFLHMEKKPDYVNFNSLFQKKNLRRFKNFENG